MPLTPPAEGEWSIRETLRHIARGEAGFFVVIQHALDRARAGQTPQATASGDFEAYAARFGLPYTTGHGLRLGVDGPLADVLTRCDALHRLVQEQLASLPDAQLATPTLWWEGYEVPVRFRLHRFDAHLRQHIIQLDKAVLAIAPGPTEAHRLLRLVFQALGEAEGAAIGAPDAAAANRAEVAQAIAARAEEIAGLAT